jgi:hypothetical protein
VSLLLILPVPRIAILAEATEVGQSNSCYEQAAALFKVSYDRESCIAISSQSGTKVSLFSSMPKTAEQSYLH